MMHEHFRQALLELDVALCRKIWAHTHPHWSQKLTDAETLITIHMARTAAQFMPFRARAYSHAWLRERCLPSQLPDHLKPAAERIYPVVVDAVGVAVKAPPERRDLGLAIRNAMSDAVADCYANGDKAPGIVKAHMMEARAKILRSS